MDCTGNGGNARTPRMASAAANRIAGSAVNHNRMYLPRLALHAVLIAFAAFFLVPLLVVVFNALRSSADIAHSGVIGLPHELVWSNFGRTWSHYCIAQHCDGIQPYFWNSVRMVVPATIIS